jgi:hypothetical protein
MTFEKDNFKHFINNKHAQHSLTSNTMNPIQPREAHTAYNHSSRDMVEFLTSEPPFDNDQEDAGTERRPFYGKSERRSGGFMQKWRHIWGPSRPDPWLPRKAAVGYVDCITRFESSLTSQYHHCPDDMVFLRGRRTCMRTSHARAIQSAI